MNPGVWSHAINTPYRSSVPTPSTGMLGAIHPNWEGPCPPQWWWQTVVPVKHTVWGHPVVEQENGATHQCGCWLKTDKCPILELWTGRSLSLTQILEGKLLWPKAVKQKNIVVWCSHHLTQTASAVGYGNVCPRTRCQARRAQWIPHA